MVGTSAFSLDKALRLPLGLLISIVVLSGSCATAWALTSSQVDRNSAAIDDLEAKHDVQNERWIRIDEGMQNILEKLK